jgi:hypothetical protein
VWREKRASEGKLATEHLTAELWSMLRAAVERLSKAEELHRGVEGGDDLVDGGAEGFGRIEGEQDRIVSNPVVEGGMDHGRGGSTPQFIEAERFFSIGYRY